MSGNPWTGDVAIQMGGYDQVLAMASAMKLLSDEVCMCALIIQAWLLSFMPNLRKGWLVSMATSMIQISPMRRQYLAARTWFASHAWRNNWTISLRDCTKKHCISTQWTSQTPIS